MMQQQSVTIEANLRQIADMLLLNGTLTNCSGLVHGKTGIAIFFFYYAQYIDNELFENYAMDLIEEIQSQIHNNSPADYERGIAGIGAGIDFLVQNDFLKPEGDIFRDFDARMYRAVMYDPWQDFSLYEGLTGYGRYWMMRLPSEKARECMLKITDLIEENLPNIQDKEKIEIYCFLHDLQKISGFDFCAKLLERCSHQSEDIFRRLGDSVVGNIVRMYQQNKYFDNKIHDDINIALKQLPNWDMEKRPSGMGLLTGYSGEGLLRLTALNQADISWMHLL